MRIKTKLFSLTLAVLLAGSLSACSDDGTGGTGSPDTGSQDTGKQDTGTMSDAAQDGGDQLDAGNDADDASTPDDTGADAPEPSDAGDAATDTSQTADAGQDTAPDTSADAGNPDTGTTLDPDAGHTGCTYPAQPDAGCSPAAQGNYGPASFIDDFVIEESRQCCTDFDGDGDVDSGLGDLALAMQSILGVPFNDVIAAQIQNGVLIYLLEYAYFDDPVDDPALQLDLVFGQDTDANFSDNLAGTGDFLIDSTSLDQSGDPKSDFPTASVSNGRLSVSGGSAPLVLPVGSELVEIGVEQLHLEADVDAGADLHAGGRVGLSNGELSGIVTLTEMFGGLNEVARGCTCLSTDPVFTQDSQGKWVCNSTAADESACANASQMCQTLASQSGFTSCSTVGSLISNGADLDRDGDGTDDAFSLGATFEAVGASITGTTP